LVKSLIAQWARRSFGALQWRVQTPQSVILCLHRVVPEALQSPLSVPQDLELTTAMLEHLILALRRAGFDFISSDAVPTRLREPGRPFVLVTLDDAYLDNLEHALPIFTRYEVPHSIFATMGLLDGSVDPWWFSLQSGILQRPTWHLPGDSPISLPTQSRGQQEAAYRKTYALIKAQGREADPFLDALWALNGFAHSPAPAGLFMNAAQIQHIAQSGLTTIGAHTMTHRRLAWLPESEVITELSECKLQLEKLLGKPVDHLAFPFGSEHDLPIGITDLVRQVGYTTAVTTIPRRLRPSDADRLLALPRLSPPGVCRDPHTLLAELAGWSEVTQQSLRRRFATMRDPL
jgi:peptidoglycan/xylan/chitin deacetylase (PgdA/CDA1 family)